MARELINFINKWKYTLISVSLLVIFIFSTLLVSKKVYKEAKIKADLTASSIASNNILIVKGIINKNIDKLKTIQMLDEISSMTISRAYQFINNIKKDDNSIYACWAYSENKFLYSDGAQQEEYRKSLTKNIINRKIINVKGPFKTHDGKWIISLCASLEDSISKVNYIGIDIDLSIIHSNVSYNNELLMAYVTVVSDDMRYIYHPDETFIGQSIPRNENWDKLREAFYSPDKEDERIMSEYLHVYTYRYYYPINLGNNNRWVITANVPNLGFVEFIDSLLEQILILAFLAILSFFILFYVGMKKWRKEFTSRKEVEADNLRLQLVSEQQHKDSISHELENLKSGLNPHFLFNSLSSLIILVKKDADLASRFARSLSSLYRYLLDYQNKDLAILEDEIDFVQDYVFLQQIRFKDKLFVDFNIQIEKLRKHVPPLSVQILIENAIKHNKISKDTPLQISIYIKDEMLVIENNLSPINTDDVAIGIGQRNLISRYKLLSDKLCMFYSSKDKYFAHLPLL